MAHNIDMTNGRANIAFLGSRNDVWHRLGQEMQDGMTIDQWAKAAGLDWEAVMVPAFADLSGPEFAHIRDRMPRVESVMHTVRSDTGIVLGTSSDRRKEVQPRETLEWLTSYIKTDERFAIDTAMSLKGGAVIAVTAKFNGDFTVGGDKHIARLLMTTAYDGTRATVNQMMLNRVVCDNTLQVALCDKRAVVKTRHSTRFNADAVGRELSELAKSVDSFKAMGDAMAAQHFAKEQVSKFFKACLDIPFDAKSDDISTRKLNQFQELGNAYRATVAEGTESETAWCALNAVTRYVDHDRSTRGGNGSADEARFISAQFGSGAAMKAKAVATLYEMTDGELLAAVQKATDASVDVSAILKQPFRASV